MTNKAILQTDKDGNVARLSGDWTAYGIDELSTRLSKTSWPDVSPITFDIDGISRLDTAGAWLLLSMKKQVADKGARVQLRGGNQEQLELLRLVERRMAELAATGPIPIEMPGFIARLGHKTWDHIDQLISLLAFVGENSITAIRSILQPGKIRWATLLNDLQQVGVNALPIIGLLSFLLGIVIAYQGGVQLREYGANVFIVELVNLTMLRELAPMMAAIIVAGRSGSAFTAQIGTMKVSEEIDALRSIGINPAEILVIPKLFALIIALPLLTVYSDIMGVLGGMVMASTMLNISFTEFLARTPEAVSLTSFMLGIAKAPVFAVIVAIVGCFQGFRVSGGADSVGRQTTMSVVQAIFLIIVADAVFSIIFSWLGI